MTLPLITGKPDAPLIWREQQVITRGMFVHAANQLAAQLSDNAFVINLCATRVGFMLAWVAAAVRGKQTILPPNQSETALQQLQQSYPDHVIIDDSCLRSIDFTSSDNHFPEYLGNRVVATLFTSGSTGTPQAHAKTWASLTRTAQLDAMRFTPKGANLVATVPSQHMFGLQTTVLLPLLGNCSIHDGKPFFPADIRNALLAIPAPRALITTPTHLRSCIMSSLQIPEVEFVLSATAPLPVDLADQTEQLWNTHVLEIYGSTEAGAIGTRRTTQTDTWQLHAESRIDASDKGTFFYASHLPEPLLLNDQLELLEADRFRLLGRDSDQVKIAGKRGSLIELTRTLLDIPGVLDGVVFMPVEAERTAALVVAPELDAASILDALIRRVDAVFLPRPLLHVDKLPRNEVGKLTQRALLEALNERQSK